MTKKTRLIVISLASFLVLSFVSYILIINQGDPMAFVMEGTIFRDGEPSGTQGYDGQFAYYMVTDPLGALDKMDHAAYRYQRILYPFLTWILSLGGQPSLVPWVMLLINIVSIIGSTYIVAGMLSDMNASPWYSFAFLLFSGVFLTLRADLTEPLVLLLSIAGLALICKGQYTWGSILFALSFLAKEVAIAFVLGVVSWLLLQREFRSAIKVFLISVLPTAVWGTIITGWLGESALQGPSAAMEKIPFYGLKFISVSPAFGHIVLWVAIPMFIFGILGLMDWKQWKSSPIILVLLANVALLAFMPRYTWWNIAGVLRLVMGLVITSLLYTAVFKPRILPWISAFWTMSGVILISSLFNL